MSLAEIAEVVGGRLAGDARPDTRITGPVEHDSRKMGRGGLFVAFAGEHVDGHDYAETAHANGAAAVLASREVAVPAVVVQDVQLAFGKLARAVIDRHEDLTVVGITGSSGKTSTKDILAQLCRPLGPTVASEGNLNNEIGMPYTVCKVNGSTRYLVLEMGARGLGDLEYLCGIAPVDIAVVLNVGLAHVGEFGSAEAIAQAKSELAATAKADGVVVLNADDERVAAMREVASARVVTFGTSHDADIRATDVGSDAGRPYFTLHTGNGAETGTNDEAGTEVDTGTARVASRLYGSHHVSNTLAAAAVGVQLGMSAEIIAAQASSPVHLSPRRMDVFQRDDGVTVIDDSYNANPSSTAAAIKALTELGPQSRTIAVLGYMAELGDTADDAHREVGELAAAAGVDIVIAVEEAAGLIAEAAAAGGAEASVVADQPAAINALSGMVRSGDVVLVKGSRYRTWKVADYLRETGNSTQEAKA